MDHSEAATYFVIKPSLSVTSSSSTAQSDYYSLKTQFSNSSESSKILNKLLVYPVPADPRKNNKRQLTARQY